MSEALLLTRAEEESSYPHPEIRPPDVRWFDTVVSREERVDFSEACRELYKNLDKNLAFGSRSVLSDDQEPVGISPAEVFNREASFFDKVYQAADELAQSNPDSTVLLLMDVDDTIGPLREETGLNLVRPAFPLVVKKLQERLDKRLEVGVLTTKKQSSINAVALSSYLFQVRDVVNPAFLLSSRGDAICELHDTLVATDEEDLETIKKALGDVLNPELKPKQLYECYDGKLAKVAELLQTNPSYVIAFVDDTTSPTAINPQHKRVRGVCVQAEGYQVALSTITLSNELLLEEPSLV